MTLTIVPPSTIVLAASMIEERESPRKSEDTSGSSDTPRMPCIGPAAAVRKAALSSSTLVSRATSAVKSTTLTVGVGTRRLKPSNLPLRSGMTSASAFAAPVVVGMMFSPAALDAEEIVDDLRRGGQAVGRAAGVADDVMPGRVVGGIVDAEDDRDVLV